MADRIEFDNSVAYTRVRLISKGAHVSRVKTVLTRRVRKVDNDTGEIVLSRPTTLFELHNETGLDFSPIEDEQSREVDQSETHDNQQLTIVTDVTKMMNEKNEAMKRDLMGYMEKKYQEDRMRVEKSLAERIRTEVGRAPDDIGAVKEQLIAYITDSSIDVSRMQECIGSLQRTLEQYRADNIALRDALLNVVENVRELKEENLRDAHNYSVRLQQMNQNIKNIHGYLKLRIRPQHPPPRPVATVASDVYTQITGAIFNLFTEEVRKPNSPAPVTNPTVKQPAAKRQKR
eukprot:Lithocolla_globosa_v1_NODE_270_length_4733_cov_5.457265.p1 type:complete len:289 gc:universal NODE_270_length_4733_cov_5.457265:1993-1127(-)